MKKISVCIPTFNEESNISLLVPALEIMFQRELSDYDYEILIIDNDSVDHTREIIRGLCAKNEKVKAIFNSNNFGWLRSPVYGLLQTSGDCSVMLCADFQDPIEVIPEFVRQWESGNKVVIGKKKKSEENKIMWQVRSLYYKMVARFSDIDYINQFTGFGLYDQKFLETLRNIKDPLPFLRGYVAEFAGHPAVVEYEQPKRIRGKSWGSFLRLYDTAMVSITSYTKIGMRSAAFCGVCSAVFSFIFGMIYLVYKITHWFTFSAGMAPLVVGMFFLGGVQLFFLGIMGEYILSINERVKNRPLVVESERINFEAKEI